MSAILAAITSFFTAIGQIIPFVRTYVKPSTAEDQAEKDQQADAQQAQNAENGRP